MMHIFQETIVSIRYSDTKTFEVEATEGFWTLSEMSQDAVKEFPDNELKQDRAVLEKLCAWAATKGMEISLGQAEALERAIYLGYEEHKKKLPELPRSPGSTTSTPASSSPSSSAHSTPTSDGSLPKKSSESGDAPEEPLVQTKQSN